MLFTPIHAPLAFALMIFFCGAVQSQERLAEDFDYSVGDSLTALGWSTNQSTITNAVLVSSPGLNYPNHPGSGLGNAAQLLPSGQDVYREFEPATEGTVFVFLLVRVQEASSGDYVLHLQSSPQSTSYFLRLFIRQASNAKLSFGIAKRGTNASPTYVYSDSVYELNATYSLVLKYEFRDGSKTDDEASLYIFTGSPLPGLDPPVPTVGPVLDATNDASSLSVVTLRQGDASKGSTVLVDALRICSSWDSCLPVRIQSFSAVGLPNRGVRLSWTTASEVNCYGFTVQRTELTPELLADLPGAFIRGQGTSLSPNSYSYLDTVPSAGTWYYRLRQSDLDGSSHYSESIVVEVLTSVERRPPEGFHLDTNYPNPFNAGTIIRFGIPVSTHVSVEVYNTIGADMGRLVDDVLGPGEYALSLEARDWPGGVYYCRMRAMGLERVMRMILVR